MDYQTLKNWLGEKENKQKFVYGACFVLVFLVGFGAGSYDKELQKVKFKSQTNYTTNSKFVPQANTAEVGTVQGATIAKAAPDAKCTVKGNISAKGKKVYHVAGGAFYSLVKPEQCFNTEAEALAAGFTKSSR